MIVVKREFAALDPNDATLGYRWDRSPAEEKTTDEYAAVKADMIENGQRSPVFVDKFYDEDFVLEKTLVSDGFRRWVAAKSDELNWATLDAVVTTWVATKHAIQIGFTEIADFDLDQINLGPNYDAGSDELALEKSPAVFVDMTTWLANNPSSTADDYTAAKAVYDTGYKVLWSTVDDYVAEHGAPENLITCRREMYINGDGDTYFSGMIVMDRESALAVVSCRERGISPSVSVRTIDRTGNHPGAKGSS